jgi:uncharacterized protein YggE
MIKGLLFCCIMLVPLLATAQLSVQPDNTLRVKGTYITKEVPEQIDFTIFIRYSSRDFKTCSDSLLILARDLTDILVENGIERSLIKISNLAVNEKYVFPGGNRVREGFSGSATIEIQSIFTQGFTEAVFTALGSVNYDLSYNVGFSLSEEQKEKLGKAAIEKAMDDAVTKAETIAGRSNLNLKRINRIVFDDDPSSGFIYSADNLARHEMLAVMEAPAFSGLELNPQEISIARNITMEWIIE